MHISTLIVLSPVPLLIWMAIADGTKQWLRLPFLIMLLPLPGMGLLFMRIVFEDRGVSLWVAAFLVLSAVFAAAMSRLRTWPERALMRTIACAGAVVAGLPAIGLLLVPIAMMGRPGGEGYLELHLSIALFGAPLVFAAQQLCAFVFPRLHWALWSLVFPITTLGLLLLWAVMFVL